MLDLGQILELAQLRAINVAINPTSDSYYRMKCREYSIKFNTPFHIVINDLDPLFVFQTLYEEQYHPSIVKDELDELMDQLYIIQDPSYSKVSKEDLEELVDSVLNKEIKRSKKNKPLTQQTIAEDIKQSEAKKPFENKPEKSLKSGGLNFSDLNKLESKQENNSKI